MHQFEAFAKIPRFSGTSPSARRSTAPMHRFSSQKTGPSAGSRSVDHPEVRQLRVCGVGRRARERAARFRPGRHFGEWYGRGIQRGHGLQDRRFALFNRTDGPRSARRAAASFQSSQRERWALTLCRNASKRCVRRKSRRPGFTRPEGIVIYHHASGGMFKVLLENDELPKGVRLLTSAHRRATYTDRGGHERTGHPDRAVLEELEKAHAEANTRQGVSSITERSSISRTSRREGRSERDEARRTRREAGHLGGGCASFAMEACSGA